MQRLVGARLASDWPAPRFHPGDVDWWAVQAYGRSVGIGERVRLWFEAEGAEDTPGVLRAYALFTPPGEVDFVTASDEQAEVDVLITEIVAWGDERRLSLASGKPGAIEVWASPREPAANSLGAMGLVADREAGLVLMTGDLTVADTWGPPELPDGLSVRTMATQADVESRVGCGRAAFPRSTMTVERYAQTREANLYRSDLDLLAVDQAGRVVAFALAWFDPASRVVELEPVGVHPAHQRRGLGRAVCRVALKRARALGATCALIAANPTNAGAVGLYRDLGLAVGTEIAVYRRPVAADDAP